MKIRRESIELIAPFVVFALGTFAGGARAWDHPGHMTTAAIAYIEVERQRPELMDQIGMLFLAHPEAAPFWVAAGSARGKEATRRKFIECARFADDIKFTSTDQPNWHTARWPIVEQGAPAEVVAAAEARQGRPAGQAIEALTLNFAMLENPESSPKDRAGALCWVFHTMGDLHQPMHVSDLFSAEFPAGNAAASMSYVEDPVTEKPIPLHILWDSNALRSPELADVDRYAEELMKKYPRSSFPELVEHPFTGQESFNTWARESYAIAVDFAYEGVETRPDPELGQDTDRLVKNMMAYILEGVAPVDEAPELPEGYWEQLQITSAQRITLAGYRMADLILAAADNIETQRAFLTK
jgi:hypothetical protein